MDSASTKVVVCKSRFLEIGRSGWRLRCVAVEVEVRGWVKTLWQSRSVDKMAFAGVAGATALKQAPATQLGHRIAPPTSGTST